MTKRAAKIALMALFATSIGLATQSAHAATFTISGGGALADFTGYGTAISNNNVVNNPASDVTDTTNGGALIASTAGSPAILQVNGLSSYSISWSYLGSESNNVDTFSAPGVATFTENNANNNCGTCALPGGSPTSPQTGPVFMGLSAGTTQTVNFTLVDTTTGQSISNGTGNAVPGESIANLVFAYATFDPITGVYSYSYSPTSFVVFGFNDNGGADDNHDDFMGVATLLGGTLQGETPIPAALPLFGSVLGGGFMFGKLRKRRKNGAAVAA